MRRLLILFTKLAVNSLALILVDRIFDGIWLETWQATVAAAVLLALVNAYLRPLVVVLTLPVNIITLGLFTIVINAFMLKLVSWLIPQFHVVGFWTAIGGALVISIVSVFLNLFLRADSVQVRVYRR